MYAPEGRYADYHHCKLDEDAERRIANAVTRKLLELDLVEVHSRGKRLVSPTFAPLGDDIPKECDPSIPPVIQKEKTNA